MNKPKRPKLIFSNNDLFDYLIIIWKYIETNKRFNVKYIEKELGFIISRCFNKQTDPYFFNYSFYVSDKNIINKLKHSKFIKIAKLIHRKNSIANGWCIYLNYDINFKQLFRIYKTELT